MEIIQLRYFLKTAQTLNYTRAAEELFTSRQALCHILNNLEQELGQKLFETNCNHLALTQYGEYLAMACADTVSAFDAMAADVARFFHQDTTLHVLFSVSLFPYQLPNIDAFLQDFSACHPNITLKTARRTADEVIDCVENGETDCGVVLQMPIPRPECSLTVLRTSDVAVDPGSGSPLFGKPELTLEDLSTVRLAGMGSLEKIAYPLWKDCRQRGLTLDYQVIPNSIDAIYLAKSGHAACFRTCLSDPNPLLRPDPSVTQSILPGYTWEIAALCPRSRPNYNAARLLAEFLQEQYRA